MYRELFSDKEKSIKDYIEKNIKERLTHILETREQCIKIATHYNEDIEKISLAALLHDISKYLDASTMRKLIFDYDATVYPEHYTVALMHAKASSIIAQKEFLITDKTILNAIERHTTGSTDMTMFDKILYVSDYIEPSRKIEKVNKLREEIFKNFDNVFKSIVIESVEYVIGTRRFLDYKSIDLYNSLILKHKEI